MIHLDKDTYIFKKGFNITCKLKNPHEVNPPEVTYTWFSCDSDSCENVKIVTKSQSLKLNSLPRPTMKYQCMAKNAAGNDSTTIHVVRQGSKCKARPTLALSAQHNDIRD